MGWLSKGPETRFSARAPPVKLRCFFSFSHLAKACFSQSHLDMTRPRAHAEPLLFSPIVHLKASHFENGFLGGNIVKSEGLSPLPWVTQYPRVLIKNSPNYFQENRSRAIFNLPDDPNKTTEKVKEWPCGYVRIKKNKQRTGERIG